MTQLGASFDVAEFATSCGVANIELFLQRCTKIFEILTEANQHLNLTRIDTPEGFWTKHIADSLVITKFYPELTEKRVHIADIGCGAGFPSLVLASAFPNMLITAIDSTGKKVNFVKDAATELGLQNLRTFKGRAGEMNRDQEWQGRFELITARAVAPAQKICSETNRMLNKYGRWILYKTPEHAAADLEILNTESGISGHSWQLSPEFELPNQAGHRQFLASTPC